MITLNAARSHLNGIIALARPENAFLPCVRDFMRTVDTDMCSIVRADTIKTHSDLADLIDLQAQTQFHIDRFLGGQL